MILLKTVGIGGPFVPPFKKIPQATEFLYQTSLVFPLSTVCTRRWNIKGKNLPNMTYQIF